MLRYEQHSRPTTLFTENSHSPDIKKKACISGSPGSETANQYQVLASSLDDESEQLLEIINEDEPDKTEEPEETSRYLDQTEASMDQDISFCTVPENAESFADSFDDQLEAEFPSSELKDNELQAKEAAANIITRIEETQHQLRTLRVESPAANALLNTGDGDLPTSKPDAGDSAGTGSKK